MMNISIYITLFFCSLGLYGVQSFQGSNSFPLAFLHRNPLPNGSKYFRQHNRVAPRLLFGFGGDGGKNKVPQDYNALHQQAIAAVQAGLKKGERRMEVEFPPLTSLNKLGDGSRKSAQLALKANAEFTQKLSKALSQKGKVWVLCYEAGLKSELGDLGGKIEVRSSREKVNEQELCSKDVLLAVGPSDESQWKKTADLSKNLPVVVVNGVFNNGFYLYEPTYYFRPLSGLGYLIRQYPSEFKVYSAKGSKESLPVKIPFLTQGNFRRPDTRVAVAALNAEASQ